MFIVPVPSTVVVPYGCGFVDLVQYGTSSVSIQDQETIFSHLAIVLPKIKQYGSVQYETGQPHDKGQLTPKPSRLLVLYHYLTGMVFPILAIWPSMMNHDLSDIFCIG